MTMAVVEHYGVAEDDKLRRTMLVDRAIRGCIHVNKGNVDQKVWPNELPDVDDKEYHAICKVVSSRDIPRTVPDSSSKWKRPYPVGARFVGDDRGHFELESVGGEYDFRQRGSRERISGHTCDDMVWQKGLKGIQTMCYHTFAVRYFLPPKLNTGAEGTGISFGGGYQIDDSMLDLYEEIGRHSTIKRSWQRLNILYAGLTGELKMWWSGKAFLDSVAKYLDKRSLHWEDATRPLGTFK